MKNLFLIISLLLTSSVSIFAGGPCVSPANELCGGATAIAVGGCTGAGQFGCNITGDPAAPSCGPAPTGSAWYSFVVPASGNVNITATLTGGFYTPIVLYAGVCGALVEVGCYYPSPLANPYTGAFSGLAPGTTVYINMAAPGTTTYSSLCVVDAGGGGCPNCANGIQDCAETGVDCGGPDCPACGVSCTDNDDCSAPTSIALTASGGADVCVNDCNTGAASGPDFAGNNCYDLPNGTVWYSITTDASAATIDISLTSGTMSATPEFTVFTNLCGPYTIVNCTEGSGGSATATGIAVTPSTTYLIAVSNVSGSAGTFNLCVAQDPDNSACNTTNTFSMTSSTLGSPQGGPYIQGDVVEFCYTLTNWQMINCNYIGAFVPSFGNCWDPASFNAQGMPINITTPLAVNGVIQPCPPGPPCSWNACVGTPSGSWNWFPAGTVTYNVNGYYPIGTPMPAGWYFLSSYSPATSSCVGDPVDPDFTYGDGNFPACGTNTFDYTICFTLIAGSDSTKTDCFVSMKTFADGEFGFWNNIGCTVDALATINGVLPVELLSFEANVVDNTFINLDWITASEINNDFFTIEKSKDGQIFEVVGIVDGAGNSNTIKNYNSLDESPYQGTSYYRLKQTDFDGKNNYSKIVAVNIVGAFEDISIFPNPILGVGYLSFTAAANSTSTVLVYDISGRIVCSKNYTTNKGANKFTIETEHLTQGMYFLMLDNGEESINIKFIKE